MEDGTHAKLGPQPIPVGRAEALETLSGLGAGGRQRSRTGVWQRFRRHRLALVGLAILTLLTVGAIAAPLNARQGPYAVNLRETRSEPSSTYILGTDAAGRDVFSRLLHAGRVSLSVGLVAVAIYTAIGVFLGALAGFYGGWVDSFIMRLADTVLAFPSLIIIITVVSVLGPGLFNLMLVIGLLGWPPITRLLRGEFLSLREREFIVAARATGAREQPADVPASAAECHCPNYRGSHVRSCTRNPAGSRAQLPRPGGSTSTSKLGKHAHRRAVAHGS